VSRCEFSDREVVATVIYNRGRKAIYLPGAVDRIVKRMEYLASLRDRAWRHDERLDMLVHCMEQEEKDLVRDGEFFAKVGFPGWREWAAHAGEMV